MQRLLDLSEEQLEDMMLLRKLYVTKRHLLSVRREALMASTRERMPHAIENVTRMSDLASQLKDNASEDHQLLYMMSRAFFCGVSVHDVCMRGTKTVTDASCPCCCFAANTCSFHQNGFQALPCEVGSDAQEDC